MKPLKSIYDEWFNAVWWSSLLFGISIITKCVVFSLTSFGTSKYDCAIKTIEILSFLPLINNSVTAGLSYLLPIISAIISSKIINTLRLFRDYILQYFCKHLAYHLNIP